MRTLDQETLERLAGKYVWWKSPYDAARQPARLIAQVMDIGDYDDVQQMAQAVGDDCLREVLTHAEVGQFNARSWAYWHYRLNLVRPGEPLPQPPVRLIA